MRQGDIYRPSYLLFILMSILIILYTITSSCRHWSHYFAGAFGYADDIAIVLLAPSASALRMMLNTYCQFATDYNLIFNHSLFCSLYQACLPVQLLHQSLFLVVNLSHWWTERPIWIISCIRIYLTLMIF